MRSLKAGHIRFFPVVPGRMEFAAEIRRRLIEDAPDVLAVELPLSMRGLYSQAIDRLPELSVITRPAPFDSRRKLYIPVEPTDPFVEALRTARELSIDVSFIEPDCGDRPHLAGIYPDTSAISSVGIEAYVEGYREQPPELTDEAGQRASGMAWKLQGSNPERRLLALVSLNLVDATIDALATPQPPPTNPHSSARRHMALAHLNPASLIDNTIEMPFLIARYERHRGNPDDVALVNRRRAQQDLLRDAELAYVRNTKCPMLTDWQRAQTVKFARNLTQSSGGLVPTLFDLTAAARAIVDDDFACEIRNLASQYEPQRPLSSVPALTLPQGSIWDRKPALRLRPRAARPRRGITRSTVQQSALCKWLAQDPILGSHKWDAIVVIFDEDKADSDQSGVSCSPWGASYQVAESGRPGGRLLLSNFELDEDPWKRPEYDAAETKAERLLLAALCGSHQSRVIYIAPAPPRSLLKSVAAHLERKIIYVPLGQVPPALLRRIRESQ